MTINYSKSAWYESVYSSLGSEWLFRSLDKLNLKDNYVLASLSANAAFYERDAYNYHKNEYNPIYFVGDKEEELKNPCVVSFNNFTYLNEHKDANDVKLPTKADVILDCKGALWSCLKGKSAESTKKLLDNYISQLNDDGKLLIDQHEELTLRQWRKDHNRYIKVGANKKCCSNLDRFPERSTYQMLKRIIGGKKIVKLVNILNVSQEDPEKPLSNKMNVACINKKDLNELSKIMNHKKIRFLLNYLLI